MSDRQAAQPQLVADQRRESTVTVQLKGGQHTLLDAADVHLLGDRTWGVDSHGYALCRIYTDGRERSIRLHREVMAAELAEAPPRTQVDHINGDRLDNRRANLRLATHAENLRNRGAQRNNTSGYKGVFWHERARRWRAVIWVDRRRHLLGYFDNPAEAHAAYCRAAHELHREFANTGCVPTAVREAA